MQTRISKVLEGIIARTAFDTARAGIESSLKDYLMLGILRAANCEAYRILDMLCRDRMDEAVACIERETAAAAAPSDGRPEEFYRDYADELSGKYGMYGVISTVHTAADIIGDTTTVSSRVFGMYGITPETLLLSMNTGKSGPRMLRIHISRSDDDPSADNSYGRYADNGQAGGDNPDYMSGRDTSDFSSNNAVKMAGRDTFDLSSNQPVYKKFGSDLTELARRGKIDPVVGRSVEIERVIQILSRRKKNNPVLIGEAGVGKSAIVEGLALRIVAGDVPHMLAGKRIFSLDLSSLVAGTKFRGEFEERMQQIMNELRNADDTILFIDEIHTIVGAGSTQGSLDTANILKPALARGEIQTIGATTFGEYRESIERDAALERRFQKVMVEPTTDEETLQILRNVAPAYERHHNVRYTEAALRACVELAGRYVTDRFFPDKALDILDEAGSRARMGNEVVPEHICGMEHSLAAAGSERHKAVAAMKYDRAAEARVREIALKSRLDEARAEWIRSVESNPATVDADSIAAVITSMTGIPAERIAGGELERVRNLYDNLAARIIGQEEAVASVSRAIRRSRSGLRDANRPVGVFLFVGPTGVGKTLLAKELSRQLFDGGRGLIRLDMSEYGEKHNVSRLIGSPPGYVGYGEGGQLTEAVRRHPYSVVLFDEIEKAHPDVFNAMLQIFDEGCLTDGSGRKVDFRNTVIIMTSNAGSRTASERPPRVGYLTTSKCTAERSAPAEDYRRAMESTFAPEFLNRIDDIVVFRRLEQADVERIVKLELRDVCDRAAKLGLGVRITEGALRELAASGYESRYGVRALRRRLTEDVEEPLATLIVEGKVRDGDTVVVEKSRHGGVILKVA